MGPNVNDIVLELSKMYSQSDIGQIFSESLNKSRLDKLAFNYVADEMRERRLQSQIMSGVKSALYNALILPYEFKEINFAKIKVVNHDSLLGSVCSLIKLKGEEDAFLDIHYAINKGSIEYLKKVPLAKYMRADQFKEYRSIKTEIQKLL